MSQLANLHIFNRLKARNQIGADPLHPMRDLHGHSFVPNAVRDQQMTVQRVVYVNLAACGWNCLVSADLEDSGTRSDVGPWPGGMVGCNFSCRLFCEHSHVSGI
jgi:hypothetical protein